MTMPISNEPTPAKGQDARVAAQQLEAYFLRRILAESGPSTAFGGDGIAGSTFRGMFEEALADAVSETGQVGLADVIVEALEGDGGRRASVDVGERAIWTEVGGDSDPEALADAALAAQARGSIETSGVPERALPGPSRGRTAVSDPPADAQLNLGPKRTKPTLGGV
ncbi:MAG: rod-binding protein [Nannocystaceae bacterium]|nr:rod-binding protein [Nannocystaceae bacterium]